MSVDKRVYTIFTKFVYQVNHIVQVFSIVDGWLPLDGLPHNTETDEVHAPRRQVCNIFIIQRELRVKLALARNVWVNLVDYVDTVENLLAALFIHKDTVFYLNDCRGV